MQGGPELLSGWDGVWAGLKFMFAGWSLIVIWVIAKFSSM